VGRPQSALASGLHRWKLSGTKSVALVIGKSIE
jgi:hypothetical protein